MRELVEGGMYYTDMPIKEFKDIDGDPAPSRPCIVLKDDSDKYVLVKVYEIGSTNTSLMSIKKGYIYEETI